MLSSRRFGIVVAEVSWQQKIIIGRSLLLPSSPLHTPTPSLSTPLAFNPVRAVLRISSSVNAIHSFSPHQSSSSFNSSCLHQRKGNSSRREPANSLLVDSLPRISTSLKGGASYYAAPSALSSLLCCLSVVLRRPGVGQQRQHRNGSNSRRRTRQKNNLFVKAIASIDDPGTELNQKNSLHEELQRYGVHESDYTSHTVEPQDPNFSRDMKKNQTTRSSSMPRKRKATVDLTSSSKQQQQQQHPPSKEKSDVLQDWCCYLLLSVDSRKTYVGVTFDIRRRLRQHNGEIAGGAKSARAGRPWRLVCTVQGFNSRSEACQFEWRWKSTAAKIKTIVQQESETMESSLVTRRRATLAKVLKSKEEWNYLNIQWHVD